MPAFCRSGDDRHGRERERPVAGAERGPAEHHVSDDEPLLLRDEAQVGHVGALGAEQVDEPSLGSRGREGELVDGAARRGRRSRSRGGWWPGSESRPDSSPGATMEYSSRRTVVGY